MILMNYKFMKKIKVKYRTYDIIRFLNTINENKWSHFLKKIRYE